MDVIGRETGERWYYSETVKDHFFNPRNLLLDDPKEGEFNAAGLVGSPACGDMMRVWLKVDPETERISDFKWRTFGCGSAIAATSMFSVMVTENGGITLEEARNVRSQQITERLGGLPARKIHCSVLVDKAFQKAANNFYRSSRKFEKIIIEGAKVIDPATQTTDRDIEEAVLEGARDLESVQNKLKVGIGNSEAAAEAEELIRFYGEKYYG